MTIIAIGGGEIGRPGTKIETKTIDLEILKQTKKKKPNLLFIPTASYDSQKYIECVKNYFGEKLGCQVSVLELSKNPSVKIMEKLVSNSNIIYVGGGNTLNLMNKWKKTGLDKLLVDAHNKGKVLCGLSAGANCWFYKGHSDSRKFKHRKDQYILVSGLGIYNIIIVPHYDVEKERQISIAKIIKRDKIKVVTLDNCAAIKIQGEKYQIITSKKSAKAHVIYFDKKVVKKEIKKGNAYELIN